MIQYLNPNIISTSIRNPVTDRTIHCYSIHNDGSSSARTMDEEELYKMKQAHNGEVKFHIMSLEQHDEANA